MIRALALALVLPVAAQAQDRLTAEEFEAYVTGKTLIYGFEGQSYGGEDYLENRRVRWSFLDGRCKSGRWYPSDGNICFVYEDNPEPQCWSFYLRGSTLVAQFENNPEYEELYETGEAEGPLQCLGPEVGV
jgi:hypothetical protein